MKYEPITITIADQGELERIHRAVKATRGNPRSFCRRLIRDGTWAVLDAQQERRMPPPDNVVRIAG